MDNGYPKDVGNGFEGAPVNINATMFWPVDNKIYFFKGSQYWERYPDNKPSLDKYYPRLIKNWEGIPNNLDTALNYSNGKMYFFKNGKYYRFDKMSLDDSAVPKYLRETGLWWFVCV
jgi:matrix metalloproteinase-14 (membrane-inserted)